MLSGKYATSFWRVLTYGAYVVMERTKSLPQRYSLLLPWSHRVDHSHENGATYGPSRVGSGAL